MSGIRVNIFISAALIRFGNSTNLAEISAVNLSKFIKILFDRKKIWEKI